MVTEYSPDGTEMLRAWCVQTAAAEPGARFCRSFGRHMMIDLCDDEEIAAKLGSGTYDFIDFGCSNGSSMQFAMDSFGARRGLGIDIDAAKVQKTRELGFDALRYDLTQLGRFDRVVSFAVLSHFLEHLPGFVPARQCIAGAISAARDFVLIRQPWFDADTELFQLGLKAYWSDWHGHTHHMRLFDLYRAVMRIERAREVRLLGRDRIVDSGHSAILPLSAAIDRKQYDPALDGEKASVRFSFPMFREAVCILRLRDGVDLDQIVSTIGRCEEVWSGNWPLLQRRDHAPSPAM